MGPPTAGTCTHIAVQMTSWLPYVACQMLIRGQIHMQAPSDRFVLGHLPTPIHEWSPMRAPENTQFFIKRDDLTGMQLSGNKVPL